MLTVSIAKATTSETGGHIRECQFSVLVVPLKKWKKTWEVFKLGEPGRRGAGVEKRSCGKGSF